MLVRTETELQFARDHVAAWNVTPWLTATRRKADETSDAYIADAEALEHNYAIFASAYAPTVDADTLDDPDAGRYVIGVPISRTFTGLWRSCQPRTVRSSLCRMTRSEHSSNTTNS